MSGSRYGGQQTAAVLRQPEAVDEVWAGSLLIDMSSGLGRRTGKLSTRKREAAEGLLLLESATNTGAGLKGGFTRSK